MKHFTLIALTVLCSSSAMADNIANLENILNKNHTSFQALFPNIGNASCNGSQIYTLHGLESAMKLFPDFLNNTDQQVNTRELAAFLANAAHETTGGWPTAPGGALAWGLCFSAEVGCTNNGCTQYCDPSNTTYPCTPQKSYYGRGPLQLSWNYNYGLARDQLQKIPTPTGEQPIGDLLAYPDLVNQNATTAWATALWFWMTPQTPKPSAHQAITATPGSTINNDPNHPAGFGLTIDIINGGLECHQSNNENAQNRVDFYTDWFGRALNLQASDFKNDDCKNISHLNN